MNSNFNNRQIKAYAAAFEEGDAIWFGGTWHNTVISVGSKFLRDVSRKNIIFDYETMSGEESGFHEKRAENQYRVTTLEHYELQGGEKIVWLGEGYEHFIFGKAYNVSKDSFGKLSVFDEDGYERTPKSKKWAVIPRYDQVQPTAQKEVEASDIVNTLHKRYYTDIQNMLHDDIQSALEDSDYRKVIKLSKMMMEMQVEHEEE